MLIHRSTTLVLSACHNWSIAESRTVVRWQVVTRPAGAQPDHRGRDRARLRAARSRVIALIASARIAQQLEQILLAVTLELAQAEPAGCRALSPSQQAPPPPVPDERNDLCRRNDGGDL